MHAVFSFGDVVLARVVGAVGEPEAERIGFDGFGDGDAAHHVAMGVDVDGFVGVAD